MNRLTNTIYELGDKLDEAENIRQVACIFIGHTKNLREQVIWQSGGGRSASKTIWTCKRCYAVIKDTEWVWSVDL